MQLQECNIALVGTYPPPIGGVSIHVKRLKRALDGRNIPCVVYDLDSTGTTDEPGVVPTYSLFVWVIRHLLSGSEHIVHYHGHGWLSRFMLLALKLRSKHTVFTFHSLKENAESIHPMKRILAQLVLRYGDHFIATGPDVKDGLMTLGASSSKISVIPPFLPPQRNDQVSEEIPCSVWSFIDQHHPLITANAHKLVFHNGEDLYGIDMCVELCDFLRSSYPDIGLIFCLPDVGNQDYLIRIQRRIEELGLAQSFLIVNERIEYYPILAQCDLLVRPTNTDSYGVSVAEALYLGVPAVASDVCKRPSGTVVFRSRDSEDFRRKVVSTLENSSLKISLKENPLHDTDYLPDLLNVYSRVLADSTSDRLSHNGPNKDRLYPDAG